MASCPPEITVDREVHQIIPISLIKKESLSDGKCETVFLHKIHGTSILFQSSKLLRLSPSVYATSTTIFHRFFHRDSCTLRKYDVWSISMGSILLACKVEEEPRRIREIILVVLHVYRRMRLCIGVEAGKEKNRSQSLCKFISTAHAEILNEQVLSLEEKSNILRYVRPLPQYGILYKEWEAQIMEMENIILRELGFTLYWIPDSHPHVFLLYFMKVLEVEKKDVAQRAWNYCNDSCRMDLCVRYLPEMIACSAIHLACFQNGDEKGNILLPLTPRPWWHAFIGPEKDDDLSVISNAIMSLGDSACMEGYIDATHNYVISLIENGSFCDPGSYSWNAMD